MSQKIRSAALVLVLSSIFVSSAYAQPRAHAAAGARTEGLFAEAWSWFVALVLPAAPARTPELKAIREQAGSQMDPDGNSSTLLPDSSTEAGSQMDPNGHK
ncbi:MAG TPA: hypothetical protein VF173_22965 [Thermoanaerobaculia bacterium]|nr:hypothetical protein [Thermoanaerobaculia bacterium]